MEWKILAFEKSFFLALCIFSFFPQGLLWSKENIHISLAHEPHNELSHFNLRLWFTWEHNRPFWPLKMLLWKNWNHFTMVMVVVVCHMPFLSLFHQNEYTFKHKRWFALAASAAATGRAYCAGYEVVDESRMNPIWGCGTVVENGTIGGGIHLTATTFQMSRVEPFWLFGLSMNHWRKWLFIAGSQSGWTCVTGESIKHGTRITLRQTFV